MMVGLFSPKHLHGQLLGKLNVYIVLAQLALTLCVHPIVKNATDGDAAIMAVGAAAAGASLFLARGLREGPQVSGMSVALGEGEREDSNGKVPQHIIGTEVPEGGWGCESSPVRYLSGVTTVGSDEEMEDLDGRWQRLPSRSD
ncbi:unnamed protein product [Discosporangium mesarthrocarpum]